MIELTQLRKVHIIGIGGIGISAVAHMLLEGNPQIGLSRCLVSGSDTALSLVTEGLRNKGAKIFTGHDPLQVPQDADAVFYTVAVGEDNPELLYAERRGIPTASYSEVLGMISKNFYTIAVAGTHGKTTTTAMLGKILVDAGLDPTIMVGSLLKENGSNLVLGKSKYLVVEADEYRKSFHSLVPSLLVITNIDEDHLDFYKDLNDIQRSFFDLAKKIPRGGALVCNAEDPHLSLLVRESFSDVFDYGEESISVKLLVPGEHNRNNARAALAAARILGVPEEVAVRSLAAFPGTWRRFEYRGAMKTGALVYDDYAHNPHKVRAALAGAREAFPDKKIVVVFRPHLYSRTKLLLREFGESFNDADQVIVADIYAAREPHDETIHARDLVQEIQKSQQNASYIPDFPSIEKELKEKTNKDTLVMLVGAGDIYDMGELLTEQE